MNIRIQVIIHIMKKFLIFILFFTSCSQSAEELIESGPETTNVKETTTSTMKNVTQDQEVAIEQIEVVEDVIYYVDTDRSTASYLAPKVFLNSGEEIVKGTTNNVSGSFEFSIGECDSSDSCIVIKNLVISANLSELESDNSIRDNQIRSKWLESKDFPIATYSIDELILPNKNFDSKIDETVTGVLKIREVEVSVPFSITAYMDSDSIIVYGVTQVETLWFGFDPPSKFNAWDVLNPIGLEIEIVATK